MYVHSNVSYPVRLDTAIEPSNCHLGGLFPVSISVNMWGLTRHACRRCPARVRGAMFPVKYYLYWDLRHIGTIFRHYTE